MIEATRVESVARVMARRYRTVSALPFLIAAAFAINLVAYHAQHGFRHGIGPAIFMAVWLAFTPAAIGAWLLAKAKRVAEIGAMAASDPTLVWQMSENLIGAAGRTDLTFPITTALHEELVTVPRATLR